MALIRCLYYTCVTHNSLVIAVHILGITNTIADALSRGLLQKLKALAPTAISQADNPILPHLATTGLTERVATLAALAIAPSSRRTYSTSEQSYYDFCSLHQVSPLPGTDTTLSYFAAHLSASLQPTSARTYMAAVQNLHLELGSGYPSGPTTLLSRVMRGIHRLPSGERTRLPISMPLLRKLCHRVNVPQFRSPHDKAMLHAAITLGFYGFLRCRELGSLTQNDVSISDDASI